MIAVTLRKLKTLNERQFKTGLRLERIVSGDPGHWWFRPENDEDNFNYRMMGLMLIITSQPRSTPSYILLSKIQRIEDNGSARHTLSSIANQTYQERIANIVILYYIG